MSLALGKHLTPPCLFLFLLPMLSRAEAASPSANFDPDPASVQRLGPAYRYPQAGWVVLHIEGEPYERGYQHGKLMAREIVDHIKTLAGQRSSQDTAAAWKGQRLLVNAVFLRHYEREFLEEMKGIADGASEGGARFEGRALDLLDIVTINAEEELACLEGNLEATPTGLEGLRFREPVFAQARSKPADHCSAFAAVGPATADGGIVFGHVTMMGLAHTRHYNVWLDIKPKNGHRVLMQSYPGGIMSGMDYYLNDAGLLVSETTIKQTRFDSSGAAMASRIRRALQDGSSIDDFVATMTKANNGGYTNEWMVADIKTNEIAMFELGTHKSRLWRSSKDEWLGGTKGFYWGCNNVRDLQVRLEAVPGVEGKPANVVFVPTDRDRAWLRLFHKHQGRIDANFGFEAFTTAPLTSATTCDAKFTTTALAKQLKSWALFGPPRGHTWEAASEERTHTPDIRPLVNNDWALLTAQAPTLTHPAPVAVDHGKIACWDPFKVEEEESRPVVWHGTLLPRTSADTWLAAAFADYQDLVALEKEAQKEEAGKMDPDRLEVALFEPRSRYLTAVRRLGRDVPLAATHAEEDDDEWYHLASGKGILFLAEFAAAWVPKCLNAPWTTSAGPTPARR